MDEAMDFHYLTLDNCDRATGCVVVIDVCRAFTTAAYAFANGADRIILTRTVEEALALQASIPESRTMGEVNGLPIPGFTYWNSPTQMLSANLHGVTLIQRTTAGTQGMLLSEHADTRLACSFTNAGATAKFIRNLGEDSVNFVQTGVRGWRGGEEDVACARYIAALLKGLNPDPADYMDWVEGSFADLLTRDPELEEEIQADLACCLQTDRFDFAMLARFEDDFLVLRRQPV
jgi:2-phosphosulfolactate phosphatase